MQISYRLQFQDHLDAFFLNIRPFQFVIPIAAGAGAILFLLSDSAYTVSGALTCILTPIALFIVIRRSIRKQLDNNPAFTAQVEADIQPDTLNLSSEYGQSSTKWSAFRKWAENEQFFLLYACSNVYYAFPKSSFANSMDIDSFRTILQEQVSR